MNTLDVLRAARDLISDESAWSRTGQAFDKQGRGVWPWQAVRWSLFGALWYVQHKNTLGEPLMDGAYDALCYAIDPGELYSDGARLQTYNDTHTHAEVLALFEAGNGRLEREAAP